MKKYSPDDLLKYIQTCSIYPGNQRYQLRFELLMAIILSIKIDDFGNEEIKYTEFQEFMIKFIENTNSITIEDFYIFNQLDLIPCFINKHKYYFFYGIADRPYESLRILEWIYLLHTDFYSSELALIKKLFLQSLRFQTKLLQDLIEEFPGIHDAKDDFQVPPKEFIEKFGDKFLVPARFANDEFIKSIGEASFEPQVDLKKLIEGDYFKHLFVKTIEKEYFILPQIHIELLRSIFFNIILKSSDLERNISEINNNLNIQIRILCGRFFGFVSIIIGFGNERERFTENIDQIIFFEDYLLLFKLANPFSKELSKGINESHQILEKCVNRIQDEENMILINNEQQIYKIQTKKLRIITFTIFESIRSGIQQINLDFKPNFSEQVFNLKDLIAMFELLPSKYSFIKYLQEREHYQDKIININGINILSLYLINNEAIPDFGENYLSIDPHFWINYYSNYLLNKYKDNIYELIEREYPHKYNLVKKWNEKQNLYECIDTFSLCGANLIKSEDRLIWVFNPPQNDNLDLEDFRFAMQVIGPMYADYIQRILSPLDELIDSYSTYKLHGLYLIPIKMCENNPKVEQFREIWSKVNLNDPIIATTFINSNFKLISLVFYDFELWSEKFENVEVNENCKYAISQFIISLINFFEENLTQQEKISKIEEFLRMHFKDGENEYITLKTSAWNPQIVSYPSFQKIYEGDQNKIIRRVEAYFRKKSFEKRLYSPQESKEIYNEVYQFLYEELRELTSSYDLSLLLKAYSELELIEARRYKLLIETGMKSNTLLNKEYLEYFRKELGDIINLSSSTKFLIENLLNFGLKGGKKINSIDYGYFQALTSYLVIISQRSEFTHSEVLNNLIEIKEYYQFDEIIESTSFDYDAYNDKEFNGKIELSRNLIEIEIDQNLQDENEDTVLNDNERELIVTLETAFLEQLGFTFTNMMRILFILSSSAFEMKDQEIFPLISIKTEILIEEILKIYKIQFEGIEHALNSESNSITEIEIRNIINYLSLDFNSYKDEKTLLQLKLLKRKERLTLCPLIKINHEGEIIFGYECCHVSFNLWRHFIFSGVFPYYISDNSPLKHALSLIHSKNDKVFEETCGSIAKEVLGEKYYIIRLKKFDVISKHLPRNPDCGEIDLLAINPTIKIIFILDAKNYYLKVHPYDIKNHIKKFLTKENSDFIKLKKKEDFVSKNLNLFLDYFRIKDKSEWKIKKGFVIKQNFPTLYVANYNVDFVFEKDLKEYLKKSEKF